MSRTPPIDARRILQDARTLAFPRYPGTEGDVRAIGILRRKLEETGLEVTEEPFSYDLRPAFRALRVLMVAAALLTAGAGLLAAASLPAAALALAAAWLGGGVFLAWAPGLERVYRGEGPTRTANVAATRRVENPRLTLVFLAHHDSKSQSLTLPWRIGMTLAAVAGGAALAALLAAAAVRGGLPGPAWLPPALGGGAAAALLVLSTLRNGNRSPGGVDNAGSVGILLELARVLPGAVDPDVELVFLSPGAEEDHMVGAMRWLDAHLEELSDRPLRAINLDGAGIPGRVALLERYGFGRRFSPELSRVARAAAGELGLPVRGVLLPPAMGVDAIPFAHRGVACLTLASGSLCRATLAVHSAGDVAAHLDPEALEAVARLAAAMAIRLAER